MVDNQYQSSLDRRTRAIKYAWVLSLSLLLIIPFVFLLDEVDQYANAMLFYQLLGYSALSIIISILSLVFIAPIFNILFYGVYRLLGVFNKDLMIPYNKDLISTVWTLFFMWVVSPPVILFYLVLLGCFSNFPSIEFLEYLTDSSSTFNILNIMIGLFGVISLMLLAWRSYAMDKRAHTAEDQKQIDQKNLELSEKRRLDERFSKALDILSQELNDSSYVSHVGAIAELSKLAIDSQEHTQACINALCLFNQWMDIYTEVFLQQHRKENFSLRKLSSEDRIIPRSESSQSSIELNHEKRSQEALKGIAYILKNIGEKENSKERLSSLSFHNKMLCGIDLSGAKLDYINFSKAYLTAADFSKAFLIGADLYKANLKGATFTETKLLAANMNSAKLMGANFSNADLSGADLNRSALHGVDMHGANLQGASLVNVSLNGAYLRNVNFMGAILDRAKLSFCMILDCNLYGTNMKRVEDADIIYAGSGEALTRFNVNRYLKRNRKFFNRYDSQFNDVSKRMRSAQRAIDKKAVSSKIKVFQDKSLITNKSEKLSSVSQEGNEVAWHFKKNSKPKIKAFLINHIDDSCDLFQITQEDAAFNKDQYIQKYQIDEKKYRIINLFRKCYFADLAKHYPYLHKDFKKILEDVKKGINPYINNKK